MGSRALRTSMNRHMFLLFSFGAILIFFGGLKELFSESMKNELYSHIILVPLVSGYLMYSRRSVIFSEISYSFWGIPLVAAGLVLLLMWKSWGDVLDANDYYSLIAFSAVIFWVGGLIVLFGMKTFKAAVFPLIFLFFMVPIPTVLVDGVIAVLQKGSAEVANAMFSLTGVPFVREGYLFHFPALSVEVAEQCSGVRSSLALFITSVLAGQIFLKTRWKKLILSLSIFPITVFKNGLRIVTLSLLGAYVDPAFLSSSLHRRGGIPFFILALLFWMPILWLLRKSETGRSSDVEIRR